jgi:3,4-dihydroxy 2-butanone 4-phosphate synthase/GTP cyclohydrolase II
MVTAAQHQLENCFNQRSDRLSPGEVESLIREEVTVNGLPTQWGDFTMTAYTQLSNGATHLAISKGEWQAGEPILARIHSSCVTGDIFGSCRCDCGPQLHKAFQMIEAEGKGDYRLHEPRGQRDWAD